VINLWWVESGRAGLPVFTALKIGYQIEKYGMFSRIFKYLILPLYQISSKGEFFNCLGVYQYVREKYSESKAMIAKEIAGMETCTVQEMEDLNMLISIPTR